MTNITIAPNATSAPPVLDELGDSLTVFGQLETEDTPSVITRDNFNRIFIGTDGTINSVDTDGNLNGSDTGIQVEGTNTIIDNQGSINGDFNGINVANGGEASAVIFNRGIITSDSRPINLGGDEGTVINSGLILSTADPRNGTVYSDVTANTFFIDNLSEGIIDVGKGNSGDAISLELGAEVDGSVINQGLVQGRGLPDGAPDNQTNQAAAVRLYWVSASGAETSIFNGNIENSGTLAAENGATVLIENRTQLNGSIINSGKIKGGEVETGLLAIEASAAEGSVSIINSGTIEGDVALSRGNDLYDGSQGTVSGTVSGNAGNDLLIGGEHEDRLQGGSGNDFLISGNGDDTVRGGAGNDFFANLNGGDDTLIGGAGNDFFRAGSGNKTIRGGTGNDLILGGDSADFINGGSGLNLAFGGGGSDRFVLSSGGFQAIADFTDGEDFLVLEGLTFDQVNILPTLIGTSIQIANTGEQIATLVAVAPNLIDADDFKEAGAPSSDATAAATTSATRNVSQGTAGDDVIVGSKELDFLNGGDGDDLITDPSGQDFINGDRGNDVIDGGPDEDVINGGSGDDVLLGNNYINGDRGDDVIRAGDGNDFLNGGSGDDRIFGGAGQDFINGDAGDDVLFGGEGADLISGGTGRDRLFGNGGTDALNGGTGDDLLVGGNGFDDLNGGEGNDTLAGTNLAAIDIDSLTGGEGKDRFILGNQQGVFYSNAGVQDFALIVDFNPTQDTLVLNGSASDFSLDNVAQNGISGIGIFDAEQDLIAIVQGVELNLTAGYVDYV